MKKQNWNTEVPDDFLAGLAILTIKLSNGDRYVSDGWVGKDIVPGRIMMKGGIAWMPWPEHCSRNPEGWLSEYRGDELPSKGDWYIISRENKHIPQKAFFNPNKGTFSGLGDVLAWMPFPTPYKGEIKL